jgi:hypothetical protein
MLKEVVLCPAEVSTVRREADVAVLSPCFAAILADEDAVARVGELSLQRWQLALVIRPDVMLEGQYEATVFGDQVLADEGALF